MKNKSTYESIITVTCKALWNPSRKKVDSNYRY